MPSLTAPLAAVRARAIHSDTAMFTRWLWTVLGWRRTIAYLAVLLADAIAPLSVAVTAALAASTLSDGASASPSRQQVLLSILPLGACLAVAAITPLASSFAVEHASQVLRAALTGQIVGAVRSSVPNPSSLRGELTRVGDVLDSSSGIHTATDAVAGTVVRRARGYAALLPLLFLSPVCGFLVGASWAASRKAVMRELTDLSAATQRLVPRWRRSACLRQHVFDAPSQAEAFVFDKAEWFPNAYYSDALDALTGIWNARRGGMLRLVLWHAPLLGSIVATLAIAAAHIRGATVLSLVVIQAVIMTSSLGGNAVDSFRLARCIAELKPFTSVRAPAGMSNAEPAQQRPQRPALIGRIRLSFATTSIAGPESPITLAPGTLTAVVGPNGSGKSTLLRALAGIEKLPGGWLTLDGEIPSDQVLFQGAIWLPSRPIQTLGRLHEILDPSGHYALATGLIELPSIDPDERLDPEGGIGRGLSGGEWQRLALERFLRAASRKALWLLDEPGAHLDAATEEHLMQSLRNQLGNRTGVVVTHNLAASRLADRVLVMSEGSVVGVGKHDELLRDCPTYAALCS